MYMCIVAYVLCGYTTHFTETEIMTQPNIYRHTTKTVAAKSLTTHLVNQSSKMSMTCLPLLGR